MGTIHKFKRPPKNENQFKGFRPFGPADSKPAPGRWKKLRSRHRAVIIWALLIAIAAGIVAARMLVAAIV